MKLAPISKRCWRCRTGRVIGRTRLRTPSSESLPMRNQLRVPLRDGEGEVQSRPTPTVDLYPCGRGIGRPSAAVSKNPKQSFGYVALQAAIRVRGALRERTSLFGAR